MIVSYSAPAREVPSEGSEKEDSESEVDPQASHDVREDDSSEERGDCGSGSDGSAAEEGADAPGDDFFDIDDMHKYAFHTSV